MPFDEPTPRKPARIALINMPFAMVDRPSIQCGLLKSAVRRAGHEADVLYLNLEFAAELGANLYHQLSNFGTDLFLGEWLFSRSAFDDLPDPAEYLNACDVLDVVLKTCEIDVGQLCKLREEVIPAWVDGWADKIEWNQYSIVGFTATFEQNNAAFALARRIKERHPGVFILFGGANFDGTMGREYMRALPFIDYAVTGEGDKVLPELVDCIARGESPLTIRGVVGRRDGKVVENGLAPKIEDMDALPDPDYDEYFSSLSRLTRKAVLGDASPQLLFETSRGCWWGEKQHCTFCGLNGGGMKFRSKSPSEAIAQLERLSTRYKINTFQAVDNILDYQYIEQFCGPLAEQRFDYRIFYEVKANLHPRQLRTMRRAGIYRIQPGIESLSSHVLALMRKGTTMLRNVRLLKWSHYYGIQVAWNILTGFPGETDADYAEQYQVVTRIQHLPPPVSVGRISLERFSPYFFDRSFPVSDVKPFSRYRFVYPEQSIDLGEVAYYFSCQMDSTLPDDSHRALRDQIKLWREAWSRKVPPRLTYKRAPRWIEVTDRRSKKTITYSFGDWVADVYELCGETERSAESLSKHLAERKEEDVSTVEIQAVLQRFCELGLMVEEKNSYLSLALPLNRHW